MEKLENVLNIEKRDLILEGQYLAKRFFVCYTKTKGGEVFRSGCCWQKEYGKVFYFQPGHEAYPTYHNPKVQRAIKNAINWAHSGFRANLTCPHVERPQD